MHAYHEGLPGYSESQILHDGCPECESRAKEHEGGLAHLDTQNFARAWVRAVEWNRAGLPDVARAEVPMLSILWVIQLKLERYGVPIGVMPRG